MPQPLENLTEIRTVASTLLRRADVNERLPTPVDDLVAVSGLEEDPDYVLSDTKIRKAPRELQKLLRSASRKIRGALDRRERVLYVNPDVEVSGHRQFVRCHETIHDALPWQRDLEVLGDTYKTLAPNIDLRFEQEANQGAAELLFQVDLLSRVARDYPTDITTPIRLAHMFGASIHATFRRWIEHHGHVVCGIVLDPKPISNSPLTFRRFEVVESQQWRHQFGANRLPVRLSVTSHPFVAQLQQRAAENLDLIWDMEDIDRTKTSLRVQSINNTYRTFVLLWVPSTERSGARRRRRGRIIIG